jgi:glycosyltransferase involved in cell wall biosynthesis
MEKDYVQASLSVVVPVHNGRDHLSAVLAPILGELRPGDDLTVVDDRSTDGSADAARSIGADVIESAGRPGAAGARNTGGLAAKGDWLLFVDSDAIVPSGWRGMLAARIEQGADAVQAVYSRESAGKSPATFYKNYYYHYTFKRRIKNRYIGGCGTFFFAARRSMFEELDGFDDNIRGATIEDADFAERLTGADGKILLATEIEVFHLREYTFPELMRYEWRMMRAKALYLLRRNRKHGQPSVSMASPGEMIPVLTGAVGIWGIPAGLIALCLGSGTGLWIALAGFLVVAAGQAGFWSASVSRGGLRGAAASLITFPDLLLVAPAVACSLLLSLAGRKY